MKVLLKLFYEIDDKKDLSCTIGDGIWMMGEYFAQVFFEA